MCWGKACSGPASLPLLLQQSLHCRWWFFEIRPLWLPVKSRHAEADTHHQYLHGFWPSSAVYLAILLSLPSVAQKVRY